MSDQDAAAGLVTWEALRDVMAEARRFTDADDGLRALEQITSAIDGVRRVNAVRRSARVTPAPLPASSAKDARRALVAAAEQWADIAMRASSPINAWGDDHDYALVEAVRAYRRASGLPEMPPGATMPPD